MTMVTLPDDPITTTYPTPTMHPQLPFQALQDLNVSIPMLPTTRTHPLSSAAILRDHPTTITTTAAASNAVDYEQLHANSSSALLDNTSPDYLTIFLPEWTQSYSNFVQSPTYQLAHPMTNLFDCNAINDDNVQCPSIANNTRDTTPTLLATLDDLSNELSNLLHASSTFSDVTLNKKATPPPLRKDSDDSNTTTAEHNSTDCANNKPLTNDLDNKDNAIDNRVNGDNGNSKGADDESTNADTGYADCYNDIPTNDKRTLNISCNNMPDTKAQNIDPAASNPAITPAFLTELDALQNELRQLLHLCSIS